MPIRLGVVGLGKIAHDQHLPTIAASPDFELIAAASHHGASPRGHTYRDIETMLANEPAIEAVSMCQPPQARFTAALAALRAGKHVFLEKPPGATLSEVETLSAVAREHGVSLFASWHSRYAAGIEPARQWLAGRHILSAEIIWKEDVRRWHPGQDWIWQPGGLGVFDPGINALSIATHILPAFHLSEGVLHYPSNQAAPIAADLSFATANGIPVTAAFDFRQTGPQTWDIVVETDAGQLRLSMGGGELSIAGGPQSLPDGSEYSGLYAWFAHLVRFGESDVDLAPLRHVADAFLRADRATVEPFFDEG